MLARPNFDPDARWYTGQGCMLCGSNYSPEGAEAGIQAIDFQMADRIDGNFGICYSHAREVGTLVGMTDAANLAAITESAEATYAAAEQIRFEADNSLAMAESLQASLLALLKTADSPVETEPEQVSGEQIEELKKAKAPAKPKAKSRAQVKAETEAAE